MHDRAASKIKAWEAAPERGIEQSALAPDHVSHRRIDDQRPERKKDHHAAELHALGQATYRSKYEFTHTLEQILEEYTPKTAEELEQTRVNVRVAGRIMAIRLMGKAGFAHLQQGGKRLQIYVKKDAVGDKGFELY